ncbi:MAG: OST-HTH/LOTUS domain-containing protein [Lachnospiraceae bacterium]|nr:OST-HTH/LOTUS domain-containing protein [Lachnospiraceae bacterium]
MKSAINELIQQSENNGEHANLGSTKSNLQRLFPDFDERNYGYSSMRKFITEATKFDTMQKGSTIYILRSSDHDKDMESQVRQYVLNLAKEPVELGTLGRMIAEQYPDFKYKEYGYARLSKYVSGISGVKVENNMVTLR